jgi:hypothetical protein
VSKYEMVKKPAFPRTISSSQPPQTIDDLGYGSAYTARSPGLQL